MPRKETLNLSFRTNHELASSSNIPIEKIPLTNEKNILESKIDTAYVCRQSLEYVIGLSDERFDAIEHKEIKLRLQEIRTKLSYTRPQLAKLAGLHRNSLLLLENGKMQPSFETIVPLAKCLNVSVDYLLGLVDYNIYGLRETKYVIETLEHIIAYYKNPNFKDPVNSREAISALETAITILKRVKDEGGENIL